MSVTEWALLRNLFAPSRTFNLLFLHLIISFRLQDLFMLDTFPTLGLPFKDGKGILSFLKSGIAHRHGNGNSFAITCILPSMADGKAALSSPDE